MRCTDCKRTKARYEDPRDEYGEEGICLCGPCYEEALIQAIAEMQIEICVMEEELLRYNARKKRLAMKSKPCTCKAHVLFETNMPKE